MDEALEEQMTKQGTNAEVLAILRASDNANMRDWIAYLDEIGPPPFAVDLPDGTALERALGEVAVPEDDVPSLLALREVLAANPNLTWLHERCVHSLARHMDSVDGPPMFQALPEDLGEVARFFYVFVYIAMLPHTRACFEQRGIPHAIQQATLADIGRNMLVHRKRHGTSGLAAPHWMMLHARGAIFQLGRLQFERTRLGERTVAAVHAAGLPDKAGDPTLSVHIPDFSGPMTPEACNKAFAQARSFFRTHFPGETYRTAVCNSWLLDAQLLDYLPETSNIVQFQRRFRHVYSAEDDRSRGFFLFVFGQLRDRLDDYPQDSTLQRALVEHIREGKEWHSAKGWLDLAEQ